MITKEQYGEWKHHPATQFFLQFLADRKNDLTSYCMDGWLKSTGEFEAQGSVNKGRILELLDISELTHDMIVNFYKERDSATEIVEDDSR